MSAATAGGFAIVAFQRRTAATNRDPNVDELLGLLRALGDASGWVVALSLAILGIYAIATGKLVPGYIYRREVARGDRAEDAVDAANKTTEQAATAVKAATDAALAVASQLAGLQSAVESKRRAPD